jgi:Ser/Thr protein kinase RdoA (MazF antagonist)
MRNFSPIFPVRDLRRALAHYRTLGFTAAPYADGDEYGFADRDGVSLHLAADAGHEHENEDHHEHHGAAAYLYVADADALYAEWTRPGVGGLTRQVCDTPYRLREGSHIDPDGNVIRFGSPMPSQPAERVRTHLAAQYGIRADRMVDLDVGVWRVRRSDGPDWVARWFPANRPPAAVSADAEILRYLAEHQFPAERCAAAEPVSILDDRALLVTEWAGPVPRDRRRETIRATGGLARLGEFLGRLHSLPPGSGAATRPGGAWHHLADGLPSAEIAAASRMLADAAGLFAAGEPAERDAYQALRAEIDALDAADGLPTAFTHPDFVLANVIAAPDGMILVDWAGAGWGPRIWSLAFFLYAEAAKDIRRVDLVLAGYWRHVTLEDEEISRLAAVARARPLVLAAWAVCAGRTTPTEAMAKAAEVRALTTSLAERSGLRAR